MTANGSETAGEEDDEGAGGVGADAACGAVWLIASTF